MLNTFNKNLSIFRKQKGLSQKELASFLNISHRMITYYENEAKNIPLNKLNIIAKILEITPADLVTPIKNKKKESIINIDTKLLKKLQNLKNLPDRDQRAISNYINALVEKNKKKN